MRLGQCRRTFKQQVPSRCARGYKFYECKEKCISLRLRCNLPSSRSKLDENKPHRFHKRSFVAYENIARASVRLAETKSSFERERRNEPRKSSIHRGKLWKQRAYDVKNLRACKGLTMNRPVIQRMTKQSDDTERKSILAARSLPSSAT